MLYASCFMLDIGLQIYLQAIYTSDGYARISIALPIPILLDVTYVS